MMTPVEYQAAVLRAVTECEQEITAAGQEYNDALHPLAEKVRRASRAFRKARDEFGVAKREAAEKRKARGKAARDRRETQLAALRDEIERAS